jgi:hypothetical protein
MEQNIIGRLNQYLAAVLLTALILGAMMVSVLAAAAIVGGVEVGLAASPHHVAASTHHVK